MLQLTDMGEVSRGVLRSLGVLGSGTRIEIAREAKIDKEKVSPTLNRLEALGLCEKPEKIGGAWTITEAGRQVLSPVMIPAYEAHLMTVNSQESPKSESALERIPLIQPTPPDILRAQEIELALDHLRCALRIMVLPASEARIYREILKTLPPVLADGISTITRWVNSHGLFE